MIKIISRSTSLQVEGTYDTIKFEATAHANDVKELTDCNGSIYLIEANTDNKTYIGTFSITGSNTSLNMNDGEGFTYLVQAATALNDFITELNIQIKA